MTIEGDEVQATHAHALKGLRQVLFVALGLFAFAGLGTLGLWLELIPANWFDGPRAVKVNVWSSMTGCALLWATYAAFELRAASVNTTAAHRQFEIVKYIVGTLVFLAVSAFASLMLVLGAMLAFGSQWLERKIEVLWAASTLMMIVGIGSGYRVSKSRNPDVRFADTASAVLLPIGIALYTGFRLALLVFILMLEAKWFGFPNATKFLSDHFIPSMGVGLICLGAATAIIYSVKRQRAFAWETRFATLYEAASAAMFGMWGVTIGVIVIWFASAAYRSWFP